MFRYCLVFICVVGVFAKVDITTFPEQTQELAKALHEQCVKDVGVDEDVIKKARDGDIPEDDKFKCYAKCLMVEGGVMDEKGEISSDVYAELLPENMKASQKKILETCAEKFPDNDDLCEKTFGILKCCRDADPENFFVV